MPFTRMSKHDLSYNIITMCYYYISLMEKNQSVRASVGVLERSFEILPLLVTVALD